MNTVLRVIKGLDEARNPAIDEMNAAMNSYQVSTPGHFTYSVSQTAGIQHDSMDDGIHFLPEEYEEIASEIFEAIEQGLGGQ